MSRWGEMVVRPVVVDEWRKNALRRDGLDNFCRDDECRTTGGGAEWNRAESVRRSVEERFTGGQERPVHVLAESDGATRSEYLRQPHILGMGKMDKETGSIRNRGSRSAQGLQGEREHSRISADRHHRRRRDPHRAVIAGGGDDRDARRVSTERIDKGFTDRRFWYRIGVWSNQFRRHVRAHLSLLG